MKKHVLFINRLVCCLFFIAAASTGLWAQKSGDGKSVASPNGKIKVSFGLSAKGEPYYSVSYLSKSIIGKSKMGFLARNGSLKDQFTLASSKSATFDENWKPVWGEVASIRNHYNELTVSLQQKGGKALDITFRAFDDGVGFRYAFPAQSGQDSLFVQDELTEFQMTGDHTAWWIPGDWDSNEHLYSTTLVSKIDASNYLKEETSISTMHIVDVKNVATPIVFKTGNGMHIAIHEAALVNFPAMQLHTDNAAKKFTAFLVPSADPDVKARVALPYHTPWRSILISPDAAGILRSKLILNLNEPNKLSDVSWIKPTKFVGIWWEMHIGKSTWDYSGTKNANAFELKASGKHGATTENAKKYIDFAAKNGFNGVLVEGWNTGWEDWFGKWKEDVFDFQTPYPDYDLKGLAAYSISKGAPLIVHHETSAAATSYEKYMDKAYTLMTGLGLHSIKTGYVGRIIPRGEYHDGQWMINHYNRVLEKAASYKIMVDAHEPVRPTGLHRTYPNLMACEAARGNEFNGWSRGNTPEHETILPFTRLLGGPMDYTPGIFDITFHKYKQGFQVHTTVAKQLALYITLYSPIQMAADLPENYEGKPEFQFIRDVAVDWDDTKILNAAIGDYITIARKAKGTPNWFIGSITDENPRDFTLKLDFLDAGKKYDAIVYEDGKDASWDKNPMTVNIRKVSVKKGDVLKLKLAAGGGCAVSLMQK